MKYYLFFFFAPLYINFAQSDSLIISDIKDFANVSANFYTSPLKFDSQDWVKLSAVIGITGIATLVDKDVKTFSQNNQNNFSNSLFSIDKYYSVEFVGASIIGLYGYGLIGDNNNVRRLAVKLTEATLLAGSVTILTKAIVGRARPYKEGNQYYTNPLTFDNDYNSFPSGHATLAFAYSTVMANEVDNVFWKVGWYTAAGLVGYARIYHNQHWISDVLMSAAIGYFSGEFVSNHDSNNNKKVKVSLYPFSGGLVFQVRF